MNKKKIICLWRLLEYDAIGQELCSESLWIIMQFDFKVVQFRINIEILFWHFTNLGQ